MLWITCMLILIDAVNFQFFQISIIHLKKNAHVASDQVSVAPMSNKSPLSMHLYQHHHNGMLSLL